MQFKFPVINNTSMAAVRTSEVGSSLAPLQCSTVEFVAVIDLRKYAAFLRIMPFAECRTRATSAFSFPFGGDIQ